MQDYQFTPWFYQGTVFESESIGDHLAFVYIITNMTDGRKYIGLKKFLSKKTKVLKGKKKRYTTESDWKSYYGSNLELQEDVKRLGASKFKREILYLCKTKAHANYLELKEQMARDVLLKGEYYNQFAGCRISGSHVKALSIP